jgi:hypothetical protein
VTIGKERGRDGIGGINLHSENLELTEEMGEMGEMG